MENCLKKNHSLIIKSIVITTIITKKTRTFRHFHFFVSFCYLMSSNTENLNKVLFQLRKIVILFFTDAAYTFADFFDASKQGPLAAQFRFYRLFAELPDDEVYKIYEHMCRRLPGLSSMILTSDEIIFNDEFIQTNELEDACILPAVDFRHFFRAPGVTQQIKDAIWTYIQSFLMLTLNDCNPLRKESSERLQRFLQGNENGDNEENINEFMELFENLDSNANFEEIAAKLNEFMQSKEGDDGSSSTASGTHQDGDGVKMEDDDAPSSSSSSNPFFDANKAKEYMDKMSNNKLYKFAQEVMEDLGRENPELLQEFERIVKEASESGNMQPMSLFKFVLSKGVSLRTLVKKLFDKLNAKVSSGEITMEDFRNEMESGFMPDLSKMSQGDLKSMMEKAGMKIPGGAHLNLNMEKMKRYQQAQESAKRMRERLAQQKKQAESAMNMTTASLSGFSSEDAALWAKNAHTMNTQQFSTDWQQKREEIEKLFEGNAGIVQSNGSSSSHSGGSRHHGGGGNNKNHQNHKKKR